MCKVRRYAIRSRRIASLILTFFFGHLDCFHIVCSNSVKEMPQVVVYEETDNGLPRMDRPDTLREECRLIFECI